MLELAHCVLSCVGVFVHLEYCVVLHIYAGIVTNLSGSLGVDVALWGHEHIYERLWPVYDYKVMNGTNPYYNIPAPVHIISGAAVRLFSLCVSIYTDVISPSLLPFHLSLSLPPSLPSCSISLPPCSMSLPPSIRDAGKGEICSQTTNQTGQLSSAETMATQR